MKIYLLRHENRTQDATFFAPLTQDGLDNSIKLISELEKLQINDIYSSPYIRTLQTIYPYSKHSKIPIKIDYCLGEKISNFIIPKNSYQVRLPKYIADQFNVSKDYTSLMYPEEYVMDETMNQVEERIKKIIKKIILENHDNDNKRIILVTHQAVANIILKIISKKNLSDNLIFNDAEKYPYPKGGLTQIFSGNNWSFKPINWNPPKE